MCHDLESTNQTMEYMRWIQLPDSGFLYIGQTRVDKFVDKFIKDF